MSDEKNKNPGVVSIPAAEYQALKGDALREYTRAEAAERQVKALRSERDAEFIGNAVRVAAQAAGVRAEAIDDVVAMLAPALRVEGGMVLVKGQPDADLGAHVASFLEARPHWRSAPGRSTKATPTPGTSARGSRPARRATYPGGRIPGSN